MSKVPDRLIKLIQESESFMVASHYDPDGDAIGSILAMGYLLDSMGKKQITIFNRDKIPYNLRFLAGTERITNQYPDPKSLDVIILLDCSEPERVDSAARHFITDARQNGARLVTMDHHATASDEADVKMHDLEAAAAGLLVMRVVKAMNVPLHHDLAQALYTAIVTDTGSFKYATTSVEAHLAAASCIDAGVNPWVLASQLYENEPVEKIRLLGKVLSTMDITNNGKVAWVEAPSSLWEELGGAQEFMDGFVNYGRSIAGVYVSLLIREQGDNRWKTSMRSRDPIDVARIAEVFKGGGHRNAAGTTITAPSMAAARALLQAEIDKAFRVSGLE